MLKELVGLLIVAIFTVGYSYLAGRHSRQFANFRLFWWLTALTYCLQIIGFTVSELLHTEKFFDLTGGITYLSLTLIATLSHDYLTFEQCAAAIMVAVWALRLELFLFFRVMKRGQDSRFNEYKEAPLKFFFVWIMQGFWVLMTMGAQLVIMTNDPANSFKHSVLWLEIIGIVIWAFGFVVETVADIQKFRFRNDPENKEKFITTGLWAFSRHPNYCGQITLWIGAAIFVVSNLKDTQFITLISPLFVLMMIWKGSGVPILEEKADKKWGDEKSYQEYKKNTPTLFPYPTCGGTYSSEDPVVV